MKWVRLVLQKSSDVITMVSLLSPTTSSDEATEVEATPLETESAGEASEPVQTAADQQPVGTPSHTWDGTPSEFRTFYLRKPVKCGENQCLFNPLSAQQCRSETEKKEDLFSLVLSQFKNYHPSGNLSFNYLGISQSLKLPNSMGKSFQFLLR